MGYSGLQWVTIGYSRLQWVTVAMGYGCNGLQ